MTWSPGQSKTCLPLWYCWALPGEERKPSLEGLVLAHHCARCCHTSTFLLGFLLWLGGGEGKGEATEPLGGGPLLDYRDQRVRGAIESRRISFLPTIQVSF